MDPVLGSRASTLSTNSALIGGLLPIGLNQQINPTPIDSMN